MLEPRKASVAGTLILSAKQRQHEASSSSSTRSLCFCFESTGSGQCFRMDPLCWNSNRELPINQSKLREAVSQRRPVEHLKHTAVGERDQGKWQAGRNDL